MHTGVYDLGALALRIHGRRGQTLVHASLVLSQYSCIITYFLFISEIATSAGVTQIISPALYSDHETSN